MYLQNYRRILNLKNPSTFHEKLNWRIVYDRRPLLTVASSKVESKKLVARSDAPISIPETLWNGVNLNDALDAMEGDWVLKASHRSGCTIFGSGRDKQVGQLSRLTEGWLNEDEWAKHRLWAYRAVPRELILERRIPASLTQHTPNDYKFFVFGGEIAMIQVDNDRFGKPTRMLYTPSWEPMSFAYSYPQGEAEPAPANIDLMCAAASNLGSAFDFVRVDMYTTGDHAYFGELTVYPAGGLSNWPRQLDERLGSFWQLPIEVE